MQRWLEAWAGFVSIQRGYVWAQLAVEASNRFDACHRYEVAATSVAELGHVDGELGRALSSPEARAMGTRLDLALRDIGESLARDRQRQGCEAE